MIYLIKSNITKMFSFYKEFYAIYEAIKSYFDENLTMYITSDGMLNVFTIKYFISWPKQ
jgi:hypothetical protein